MASSPPRTLHHFSQLPVELRVRIYAMAMAVDSDTMAVRCSNGKYLVSLDSAGALVSREDNGCTGLATKLAWHFVELSVAAPEGQLPSDVVPIVADAGPRYVQLRESNAPVTLALEVRGEDYDGQTPICLSETVLVTLEDAFLYCQHLGAHILSVSPPTVLRAQSPLKETLADSNPSIATLRLRARITTTTWPGPSASMTTQEDKNRWILLERALRALASPDNELITNEGAHSHEVEQWIRPKSQNIEEWMRIVQVNQRTVIAGLHRKYLQAGATDIMKSEKSQFSIRDLLDRVVASIDLCAHARTTPTLPPAFRGLASHAYFLTVNLRALCPDQRGDGAILDMCRVCNDHPCYGKLFRSLSLQIELLAAEVPGELRMSPLIWLMSQTCRFLRHALPLGRAVTTKCVSKLFGDMSIIINNIMAFDVQPPVDIWLDFARLGVLVKECAARDYQKRNGLLDTNEPAFGFSPEEMAKNGDDPAGSSAFVLRKRLRVLRAEETSIINVRGVRCPAGEREIATLPLNVLRGEL